MIIKFIKILLISFLMLSCSQERTTAEYLQSGKDMLAREDWKSAIIEFKNARKQSPENVEARVLLAKTRVLLGESYLRIYSSHSAVKEFERARELEYEDAFLLVLLAEAYRQIDDNESVIKKIQVSDTQAAKIKADIHAQRARSFLLLNKPGDAKRELDLAKSLDENSPYVRIAWAEYEKLNKDIVAQRKWLKPLITDGEGVADAWTLMGEIEQQENNLEAAERAFTRAIELRGVVHFDVVKRAMVRVELAQYDAAMEDINRLKKAGYPWPMVGYAEGFMASHQKNYDQARSIFEQVLSEYPDYYPAWLLLGLTQYEMGNYPAAVTNLGLYIANDPDSFQANLIYAVALVKVEKADEAIPVLEKLYSVDSQNFQVVSNLGYAYLVENLLDKSVRMLTRAIKIKPQNTQVRIQLASALLREDPASEQAQQQLVKAIQLDPELFEAELTLFMSYMRSKEFTRARNVAQILKQEYPEKVEGFNLSGLSYAAEGNRLRAEEEFKAALKLFPADPVVSNNLAKIYFQDNRLADAKALSLRVLEKKPADLKTINQLALIAAREGDHEKLEDWLELAVEKNPEVLSARLFLASQYVRTDKPGLAVRLLQDVKPEVKEGAAYALLMAQAKIGIQEYQHAARILNTLLIKEPDLSPAYMLLAKSYAYQENKLRMREALDQAIKLDPANFSAQLMSARLALAEGDADGFKKRMATLVKNYPDSRAVQFLNAKVENSDRKYESAVKTLKTLMIEAPRSEFVIDLSKNQWNTGDKDAAISGLELWLEDNPDDRDALLVLAQFYEADRREPEAVNIYKKLQNLSPDSYVVLNNLAMLMIDTDVNQGIRYAKKARAINPDEPLIEDTLAMLLLRNGEISQALKHARLAASKLPDSIDIQLNYAKVLSAHDCPKKARKLLEQLLKSTRENAKRKMIQSELNKLPSE